MIADVVFDLPVAEPFLYSIPAHMTVVPGQRVLAPLHNATRVGLVVSVRDTMPRCPTGGLRGAVSPDRVKALTAVLEHDPILSPSQLDVARWIASESGSSLGSTCAALLPPAGKRGEPFTPAEWSGGAREIPELLTGSDRVGRLMRRLGDAEGGVLVLTADIAGASEWATRLERVGPVVRLDSGVGDRERRHAWSALAAGRARLAVGTRSALLAPVPSPGTLVLIDEHEVEHRPPGPPRIHSRHVVLRRAAQEGCRLLLTSATPSAEIWWRADSGEVRLDPADPKPWPTVSIANTRGRLRADPLTPQLARATTETLARGQRVALLVSRRTSSLACDECGAVLRCPECALALSFSRLDRTLSCRQCGSICPAPDTCAECAGRRLSLFGWSAERVEHAVQRRFPRARITRYESNERRGRGRNRQRSDAARADIVIGTRGALRLFAPESLGLVGLIAPDQLLRIADFRASERAFALLWASAELVRADGQVIVQSQNPDHYALRALVAQDLAEFYKHELRSRAELGYPPFGRLCRVTARARTAADARKLADACAARLREAKLTAYGARPERRGLVWTIVVKGPAHLPALLTRALQDLGRGRTRGRGMLELDMDPID
jgi:primosomal protein N' (replication factor Y)